MAPPYSHFVDEDTAHEVPTPDGDFSRFNHPSPRLIMAMLLEDREHFPKVDERPRKEVVLYGCRMQACGGGWGGTETTIPGVKKDAGS